jgi:hypothetical protein
MKDLKRMKKMLMEQVEMELENPQSADTKELGEVVDMIKDIAETMYYCSIVKAMEKSEPEEIMAYHDDYQPHIMKEERPIENHFHEYKKVKKMSNDPILSMQHLEGYINELQKDIMEMASTASPEEKQMLQKKIAVLASKLA